MSSSWPFVNASAHTRLLSESHPAAGLPVGIAFGLGGGRGRCCREWHNWGYIFSGVVSWSPKLLGLQEMRNQGRERVSTRECCPCLSSALPLPPSWWNGCGETPSCSLQCEMGDVASVGLSQSLRTPVITFVSFDCLPVTFFSKSSASFQGLGLL